MVIQFQRRAADDLPSSRRDQRVDSGLVGCDTHGALFQALSGVFKSGRTDGLIHSAKIYKSRHESKHIDQVVHCAVSSYDLLFRDSRVLRHKRQIRAEFSSVAHWDHNSLLL